MPVKVASDTGSPFVSGSGGTATNTIYVYDGISVSAKKVVDGPNRKLIDSSLVDALNWSNRTLRKTNGAGGSKATLNWTQYWMMDGSSDDQFAVCVDWFNRKLYPSGGLAFSHSLDWQNYVLFSADVTLNWSTRICYNSEPGGALTASIKWGQRLTLDHSQVNSIDWDGRTLIDSTNVISQDWEARALKDTVGGVCVLWGTHQLVDNGGNQAANWNDRKLFNSGGAMAVDWSAANPGDRTTILTLFDLLDVLQTYGIVF